jgi:uncharacterized iron-regulated membrane protein
VTELGVLTHVGTQFGVVDRIVMTVGALLVLVSIATSMVMWWIRRPSGRAGLPKRPMNPRLPTAVVIFGVIIGVLYPLWGVCAIFVVLLDRYVIRRIPRLRGALGLVAR